MKHKKSFILILMIISIISVSGCKQAEETIYNRSFVTDGSSIPFHVSSFTYNNEETGRILTKLNTIYNSKLNTSVFNEEFIIVNHDGKDLTDEFVHEEKPSYSEISETAKEIKDSGYLIVSKDYYYVTSIEKEIDALFDGERQVYPEILDKIIEDNSESYENKDYEAIYRYLMRNNIMVWKQMFTDEKSAP